VRGRAVRLASLGFAAFALDYHGGGRPWPMDEAQPHLMALIADRSRARAYGRAGLAVLLAQPEVDATRVAAIGYCFGGSMSFELARDGADLRAVVGFHAGLETSQPARAGEVRAAVLACIGADDPIVPLQHRNDFEQEMRDAQVADWRLDVYGGAVHCFTNPRVDEMHMPEMLAFDAAADHRSWRAMLDLFEQYLGPID
jgi:dienelactone hydrolase